MSKNNKTPTYNDLTIVVPHLSDGRGRITSPLDLGIKFGTTGPATWEVVIDYNPRIGTPQVQNLVTNKKLV
ncbi:MAG: hypothetical protein ACYTBX_03350 [Planctomycetota bacterium]|jgi:hypothetical protein